MPQTLISYIAIYAYRALKAESLPRVRFFFANLFCVLFSSFCAYV